MGTSDPDYQKIVESIERLASTSLVLSDPLAYENADAKSQLQAMLSFQRKQAFWLSAEKLFEAYPELEAMKVGFKGEKEFFEAFRRNPKAHAIYFLISPVWKEGLDAAAQAKLSAKFYKDYAKIAVRMGKSIEEKNDAVGPFAVSFYSCGRGSHPSVWGGFEQQLVWDRAGSDKVLAKVFGDKMFGIWKSFKEAQDLVLALKGAPGCAAAKPKSGAGRI